jgi:hypothetical protein
MADWGGAALVLAGSIPFSVSLTVATLRARASCRWPRVNGVFARSEFFIGDTSRVLYRHRGLQADPRSEHLLGALPIIAYDYRVGSTAYVGTRLRFGPILNLPAAHWIRAHQRGVPVSVAYDPRRPNISVLEPGVSPLLAMCLAISVAFVGAGLWWLVVSLRG